MAEVHDYETGSLITAGLQGCKVCDEALIAARNIARDRGEPVILVDDDGDWTIHPTGDCEAQMDRAEHLAWCKQRALEYLDRGDLTNAVASMSSDLTKHPETSAGNPYISMLGMQYVMNGDAVGVRRWIEGFN